MKTPVHFSLPSVEINPGTTIAALLLFTFLVLPFDTAAQVPQGFTYQALATTSAGEPIRNQSLPVRLTIQSDSLGGIIFWKEWHPSVVTNNQGFFSVVLGRGTKLDGAATFGEIDWSTLPKFIKTEINNGTWQPMGSSRIWSVPYAATAGNITGSLNKLEVAGKTPLMDQALFVVRNVNGDTVFAVYNEGVRINVGDGNSKASKGGFAIGSFDETKGVQDFFVVNQDCVRVYIDNNPAKAVKGGFAIGSFDESKQIIQDYLRVNPDSVRVYIDDAPGKAVKGGFAIGSFDESKAPGKSFFDVSVNNLATINPSENRILWYPLKNAFLTGRVLIQSPDSVGVNSFSSGFESKAIGSYSQALGYSARARGNNSTAIGNNSNAVGAESYAFGNFSLANDSGAYAIGTGAVARGRRSFALGSTGVDSTGSSTSATKAIGNYSYAFGMGSVATGKGAFAIGTQDTTAGDYSVTIGYQNKSGNWAGTAIGYKSKVTANGAMALGYESKANAIYSTAIGYQATTATGWFSVAIGERTSATGTTAISIGRSNTASGNISNAIGYNNIASGPGASAFGANNNSSTDYSMAIGYFASASGKYSVSLGSNTKATGLNTISIGNGSVATFNDAVAIGYQDTATGNAALATGRWTKSSGIASFAAGDETKASGQGAFSTGYRAIASGFASLASGSQSVSSGSYSFATGYRTTAATFGTATFGYMSNGTGTYSIAAGYETTSQAYASLVLGRYNLLAGNTTNWLAGDPVFVIGNGTSTTARANALTILKNGRVAIGHDTPSEMLDIQGNIRARTIGSGTYVGPVNRTSDGTFTTATSDIRMKDNISTLTNSLQKVMQLRGVSFTWKTEPEMGTRIGMVAQEVEQVIPELVFTNEIDGYKGINYAEISAVLVEAVKEQQTIIERQNRTIEQQQAEFVKLREELEYLKTIIMNGNRPPEGCSR